MSSNVRMQVVNVDLCERAKKIASENRISFGEALSQARSEARGEMADIVTKENGSPLRDEGSSSTPPSSEVRIAVTAGLNKVAPLWKKDGDWIATSGSQMLRQACAVVAVELGALGIGDELISAMMADLFVYLSYRCGGSSPIGTLSDLVAQAADHAASAYEQSIANRVETQSLAESQIEFAHQVARGARSYVSVDSVVMRDKAMEVSRDRGVSFGEALRIVRHSFASDVVEPDVLKASVLAAMRDKFGSILQGKQKVVTSFDLEQIKKAATDAVAKLNISGASQVHDAVQQSLSAIGSKSGQYEQAAINPADVESIVAKAATSAAAAYSKHLSSVS